MSPAPLEAGLESSVLGSRPAEDSARPPVPYRIPDWYQERLDALARDRTVASGLWLRKLVAVLVVAALCIALAELVWSVLL